MKGYIRGTAFEFFHHHKTEGVYWNPQCREFTEEQWREKIREMAGLKMEYIFMMCTSLAYEDSAETYYDNGPFPFPEEMACKNPMEAVMDECDKQGIKVFMGGGFYGNWVLPQVNMTDLTIRERLFQAVLDINEKFGYHESFYGWYYSDEIGLRDSGFPDFYCDYVNACSAYIRKINPEWKILLAPYGVINAPKAEAALTEQLKDLDCDFIAWQDGIGCRHIKVEDIETCYAALKRAHDKAGRSKLWADMETFEFTGDVYKSALVPAAIERIEKQIDALTPYVEVITIYIYQGTMCPPDSPAQCGHETASKLYVDYKAKLDEYFNK